MEGSELVIILSLSAIFVLLRLYRKPADQPKEEGSGPVRSRRAEAYALVNDKGHRFS